MNICSNSVQAVRGPRSRQRGIVFVFALIVLVIMSMASLMMLRSVKSGLGIAGNVGFKQSATSAADLGIENARAWLMNVANSTEIDSTASGYYATANGGVTTICPLDGVNRPCEFNPLTYDWDTVGHSASVSMPTESGGERIQYVTHRLCAIAGASTATGQTCVVVPGDLEQGTGGGGADSSIDSIIRRPYFRVTARVTGARNTVSFVQVIMF